MEIAHLNQLIELEDSYWWHVAKRSWATELLKSYAAPPSKIIEGGIGAAGNLVRWRDMGYNVTGLDFLEESVQHASSLGLSDVYKHDLHEKWPVQPASAQAIVLLDVLEHLKYPVLALRNAAETLTDHGKIIFTVPAYPILYSDWDERLGHYRRYTSDTIRQHATEAGLRIEKLSHWNSFTLPVAFMIRLMRKIFPSRSGTEFPRVSRFTNQMLIRFASWERSIADKMPVPMGLSLVGVLSK
jgi:SAM-dependent methyltransferase